LKEKGISATIESLLRDIRQRDERDRARAAAPLAVAADAAVLDTTNMTIDAAIGFVLDRYRAAVRAGTVRS
jgi:cytidylate kinase